MLTRNHDSEYLYLVPDSREIIQFLIIKYNVSSRIFIDAVCQYVEVPFYF